MEKYLKSYIVAYDFEFEKVHNLIIMLNSYAVHDASLKFIMKRCELLNTAYIDTRYPVEWPTNYTKEKALSFQEGMKSISNTIKELLKKGGYV